MKVLALDFESTGLDFNTARIVEVGAVLFDVDESGWHATQVMEKLCWSLGDAPIPLEASKVNGITDAMLQEKGIPLPMALTELANLAAQAEMVVAHNSSYDRGILDATVKRDVLGFIPGLQQLVDMPWICSCLDLKSNKQFKSWKLSHLALDYGVAVDPSKLHRAKDDVLLLGSMLHAAKASPQAMLEYQKSPSYIVAAIIPAPWIDGGKGKDQAVKMLYGWQKARGTDIEISKSWVKKIKEVDLEEERRVAPFEIKIIQPA